MKRVSIIIATANRPDMLRKALASVQAQSARDIIAEVFVSENGGNEASRRVCDEFPDMPVVYLMQYPPLTPLDHGRYLLWKEYRSDYVAILHDDDIWHPEHLQAGVAALDRDPDAGLYGCRYILSTEVYGFASQRLPRHSLLWLASLGSTRDGLVKWNARQVLPVCGLCAPIHFSSMIWRNAYLTRAAKVLEHDLHFDTDRTLIAAAAFEGAVLFDPQPHVVVLEHPGQHQQTEALRMIEEHTAQTTQVLAEMAAGAGYDLPSLVADLMAECPAWALSEVIGELSRINLEALYRVDIHGALNTLRTLRRRLHRRRSLARWIPPVLARVIVRLLAKSAK